MPRSRLGECDRTAQRLMVLLIVFVGGADVKHNIDEQLYDIEGIVYPYRNKRREKFQEEVSTIHPVIFLLIEVGRTYQLLLPCAHY